MPFPALPSGNNPAAGAAASAASSAGSIMNALTAAANQQAAQKRLEEKDAQAQAQREFSDRIRMATLGGTQDSESSGSTHPGAPTLKLGDQNPDSVTQARKGATIKDPQGGGDWYVPTAEEKATKKAANDPENFHPTGPLGAALQAGGAWDGKKDMTPAQSHALMQSINIAQEQLKGEPFHIDLSGKFTGPDGKPAGVLIGEKTGKVRMLDLSGMNGAPAQPGAAGPATPGAATGGPFDTSQAQSVAPGDTVDMQNRAQSPGYGFSPKKGAAGAPPQTPGTPGASPNGAFTFKLPDKPEKEPRKETADDWVRIMTDPASDPKEVTRATAALKLWRAPGTEADKYRDEARVNRREDKAEAAGIRQDNKDQGARDRAQKQIDIFQAKEQEQHQKVAAYGKVLSQPNTVSKESNQLPVLVIDPKTGREVALTEQRRAQFQSEYQKAAAMADTWHQQATKLVQRHGGDTGEPAKAPQQKPAQPVAAPVATPAAKPAAPVAAAAAPVAKPASPQAPPASVTKGLAPGTHTFGNKQVWRKGVDGTMTYVSGGQ